jgi:hypothetical protein
MTRLVRSRDFGALRGSPKAMELGPSTDGGMTPHDHSGPILTDQQAVQWLSEQPDGQVETTMTELAASLGWSRPTLGRRVDQGLIARRPGKGRASIFSVGSTVGATEVAPTAATISPNSTVGVSVDATIPPDPTTVALSPSISPLPERSPSTATDATTVGTFVAALALAVVSGEFSIVGLTGVFAGAFWPIICMGAALEVGKLSAVAWLGRHSRSSPRPLKAALVTLVAFLMTLNAIGAYGYLTRAHIEHALAGDLEVAGQAAEADAKITVQTTVVADLDRRIGQIDGAIETATQHGRSNTAMALADQQRKTRTDLAAARILEGKSLAALQVDRARVDGERRRVEADLGPVRYISALIGVPDGMVMRWFILAVAIILDPAAVLLLLASSMRGHLLTRQYRKVGLDAAHRLPKSGLLKGPL